MSVSRMEKLTVMVPKDRLDTLLSRFMRLRCIHLVDTSYASDKLVPYDYEAELDTARHDAARIDAVLPALRAHTRKRRRLLSPLPRVKRDEFRSDGRMDLALKVVEEAERILARKQALLARKQELWAHMEAYAPYLAWNRSLDDPGTQTTELMLGAFGASTRESAVMQAIANRAALAQIITRNGKGLYVALLVHEGEREDALGALSQIGFVRAVFPDTRGTAKRLYDAAAHEREEITGKLDRLERRLAVLAERLFEVEALCDIAHTECKMRESFCHLASTQTCALLTAFCPADKRESVERVLESMETAYEFEEGGEGEDVPVLLHNAAPVAAFEHMLGTDRYPVRSKFDPTLLLGVLFCLLFGMAFADAGYGALMLGASLLALRFWKVSERAHSLLWIPACCGAFSLLFGVLIGVYFGSLPALLFDNVPRLTLLPPGVVRVLSHLLIAENPVGVAAISFLLGSLHLVCTMTAQAIGLCRAHRVKDALLDIVPLAVFFCGLVALIFSWLLGVIVLGCAVVAIFVIGVLAGKGFKDRCRKGLLGFSKLLRYVGMLLFFGRPFALGMVVCALGLACRAIPRVAGAPFFPLLVMLLCLGLTYLVCIVIDLLLDRAHEGGLPCADFFGNFYAHKNPAFDPLMASERYTQDVSPAQSKSVVEVYDDRT